MKQGSAGVGYWDRVWIEFKKDSLAYASFFFIVLLAVTAIFESFLAGNRPIVLVEEGKYYFPVVIDYPELRGEDLRAMYLDDADSFAIFPPCKVQPHGKRFLLRSRGSRREPFSGHRRQGEGRAQQDDSRGEDIAFNRGGRRRDSHGDRNNTGGDCGLLRRMDRFCDLKADRGDDHFSLSSFLFLPSSPLPSPAFTTS